MADNDRQIVLRAPGELMERAARIRAAMERQGIPITTSAVLRKALERGLKVLERRHRRTR